MPIGWRVIEAGSEEGIDKPDDACVAHIERQSGKDEGHSDARALELGADSDHEPRCIC
jgi:hypothetical protein